MKGQPTDLAALLAKHEISQSELARAIRKGRATVQRALQGQWPAAGSLKMKEDIRRALQEVGANKADIAAALDGKKEEEKSAPAAGPRRNARWRLFANSRGVEPMLLRKQELSQDAAMAFGLNRDPFQADVQEAADVYLSPEIRYVREQLWAVSRHGGMLAVIGESGAGKSTLRRDLIDRAEREKQRMVFIEPYVLAMSENDRKGKALKAAALVDACIRAINPQVAVKASFDRRCEQLHELLKASHRLGVRHVIMIEEAHDLPEETLKQFKRLYELEDGFKKLMAIIMFGQTEMRGKLDETRASVREVVQRCSFVELPALGRNLEDYLTFKLKRVGGDAKAVFAPDAYDALRQRLQTTHFVRVPGRGQTTSMLYPLAVANVVIGALNLAARAGAPVVDAALIKEVV